MGNGIFSHDASTFKPFVSTEEPNKRLTHACSPFRTHKTNKKWKTGTGRPDRLILSGITFARFTGDDSQEAQQADFVHGQAGVEPRRVQATPCTALLSGHPSHQHHVTPLVLTLQPAHPSWRDHHTVKSPDITPVSWSEFNWLTGLFKLCSNPISQQLILKDFLVSKK